MKNYLISLTTSSFRTIFYTKKLSNHKLFSTNFYSLDYLIMNFLYFLMFNHSNYPIKIDYLPKPFF